jgi:hypothetical protein
VKVYSIINKYLDVTIDEETSPRSPLTVLSSENKNVRFRVNSLLDQQYIQTILIKVWKLMLDLAYNTETPVNLLRKTSMNVKVYVNFYPLFKKALGFFYSSDYYTSKPGQVRISKFKMFTDWLQKRTI